MFEEIKAMLVEEMSIDEAEINKNVLVDLSIIGDIKEVLTIFNDRLEQCYHKAWMDKVMARKDALPMTYDQNGLTGPYIMEKISENNALFSLILFVSVFIVCLLKFLKT